MSSNTSNRDHPTQPLEEVQFAVIDKRDGRTLKIANSRIGYCPANAFSDLEIKPEIIKKLNQLNLLKPDMMQTCIYLFSRGPVFRNVIVSAPVGIGKTTGYTITCINKVNNWLPYTQALIITHTLETAKNLHYFIQQLVGDISNFQIYLAVAGKALPNEKLTSHVVVGTCGTILKLCSKKLLDLDRVGGLYVDEADIVLNALQKTHFEEIDKLVDINVPRTFIYTSLNDDILHQILGIARNPVILKMEEDGDMLPTRLQYFNKPRLNSKQRASIVKKIVALPLASKTIIFCKNTRDVLKLKTAMEAEKIGFMTITKETPKQERLNIFLLFSSDIGGNVLLTTNIYARGVDIVKINIVINNNIPQLPDGQTDFDMYYNRVGRSGRNNQTAISLIFANNEQDLSRIRLIGQKMRTSIKQIDLMAEGANELLDKALRTPISELRK